MNGILVINHFLKSEKFNILHNHLTQTAKNMGITLNVRTNQEMIFCNDGADFVLFWDKDTNLAQALEARGYKVFNSAKSIALCECFEKAYEVTKSAKDSANWITSEIMSILNVKQMTYDMLNVSGEKLGELIKQEYISGNRMELHFDMPLGEIVIDFYDKLKSISKGYASFDWHHNGFRPSNLVKLDILLNGEQVDALSTLTHRDNAESFGRRMCEKLKELLPRQQFDIAIQAAIGAKIIARETVKQVRKDVLAKCYGGDVSRKRKLLEKQKKGKKRMKQIGNVEVPQKAFLAVLKLD